VRRLFEIRFFERCGADAVANPPTRHYTASGGGHMLRVVLAILIGLVIWFWLFCLFLALTRGQVQTVMPSDEMFHAAIARP
jgi:hypothetical protein